MSPPTFTKGIGRLAVDRYDFQTHINGQGFRQNATTIDVANPSLVYGSPSTVEMALEDLNTFIMTQINAGQGFCVVGDGYNVWEGANGTINFNNTIPSLDTILNPVFTAIINDAPLPVAFQRVKYGGIVLIKAGTYIVKQTIVVPPGITLLGEGYGTKIVNATSLDFSGSTPPVPLNLVSTAAPVFSILADGYRAITSYSAPPGYGAADGAVDKTANPFIFSRETCIFNMVIADNFIEPTQLGDTYYLLPQNATSSTALNPPALITQQVGSSLSMYGVVGSGRVVFSSGKTVSSITGTFLALDALDGYSAAPTETFCRLENCFFDGFALPVDMSSILSNDGYGNDFLEIKNCRIRTFGYLNGDSTDGYANTTIKCNVQNVNISNSLFYGNSTNITSLLYLTLPPSSIPALQDRSKIIVMGNQVIIDKNSSDNSINSTWFPIYFSSSISSPSTVMTSLVYGNDFQDTFDIYVDDGYKYSAPGIGAPQLSINRATGATTLRNNNITLDGYTINLDGYTNVSNMVGTTNMNSATLQVNAGSTITNGGTLNNLTGSTIICEPGASVLFQPGSVFTMDSKLALNQTANAMSPTYAIDSGPNPDLIILCNSGGGALAITLPAPTMGRLLIIMDWAGAASGGKPISIHQHAADTINGLTSVIITFAYSSITLWSDGINWFVIAYGTLPSTFSNSNY